MTLSLSSPTVHICQSSVSRSRRTNTTILFAQKCDVSDDSVPALLAALARPGLQHVDLRNNLFSPAAETMIRAAAGVGQTIFL